MKTKLIATSLLTLATLAALPASAQSIKPGLWEVKSNGSTSGAGHNKAMAEQMARMKEQMAAMPAAQRQQIEAAMAKAGAADFQLTDDGVIMKHCLSKEQAADYSNLIVRDGSCTAVRSPAVAGISTFTMTCTKPQATGSGTVKFQGDTGYTLDMTMTTSVGGQSHTSKTSTTGKWLAASCGNVKPIVRGE